MRYIYLVLPTINGEISGNAFISLSLDINFGEEVTIYKIDLHSLEVYEICMDWQIYF